MGSSLRRVADEVTRGDQAGMIPLGCRPEPALGGAVPDELLGGAV